MKIDYFLRHPAAGFSIERVAMPYIEVLAREFDVEIFHLPEPGSNPRGVLKNLRYARRVCRPGAICHITGDNHYLTYVLPREKTIVTVHDIAGVYAYSGSKIDLLYYKMLFVASLKRAARVVAVSEFTRSELLKYTSLSPKQIKVIDNPLPEGFSYSPKKEYPEKPVILFSGSTSNKNLLNLVRALNGLPFRLRIIAKPGKEEMALLQKSHLDYSIASGLSDKAMIQEYRDCDYVAAVSTFEGFGVPIIEAQAVGRPAVTSCIEPMTSVAGMGAVKADPFSVESIRNAFLRLHNDPKLRESIVRAGRENVARFVPENIAADYLRLYWKCEL